MLEDDDVRDLFASVLGGVYGPAVLVSVATGTTRNSETGVFPRSTTTHEVLVQRDSCTQSQRAQKGFSEKDVRFLVLQSGVGAVPGLDDKIVHRGETYTLMDVEEDPFRVYWDARARRA